MRILQWLTGRSNGKTQMLEEQKEKDPINKNYICMPDDPIRTMNDLRDGDWFLDKVANGIHSGMIRYARESEVEAAREIGRVK